MARQGLEGKCLHHEEDLDLCMTHLPFLSLEDAKHAGHAC